MAPTSLPVTELVFRSCLEYCRKGKARPALARTLNDAHPALELNYVESGAVTYLYGGNVLTLPRRRLVLFWGIVPHQVIACEKETRHHWMEIPLATFLQWKLPDKLMARLIAGDMVVENDVRWSDHDGFMFYRWHESLESWRPRHQQIVALEVEARVWRLASPSSPILPSVVSGEQAETQHGQGLQKIGRMAAYVADHYTEPLRLEQVAREVRLRPDYATTLFKKISGLSIMDYVTQHRIAHAKRLLLTTNDKVLDIALQAGFGSSSRFYEAFAQACPQSPQDYRKMGQNSIGFNPG